MINSALEKILKQEKYVASKIFINDNLHKANKDGYYISSNLLAYFDIDYLRETLRNWESHDQNEFNNCLQNILDESLSEIKSDILKVMPLRSEIVKSIFNLYESKEYWGMIPLVLTQVDGIMKEITLTDGFYATHHGRPKYLDKDLFVHFISSFEQLQAENRNDYQLLASNCRDHQKFNRHAILHGESLSFGHRVNAIKSIALLDFVSEILHANSST